MALAPVWPTYMKLGVHVRPTLLSGFLLSTMSWPGWSVPGSRRSLPIRRNTTSPAAVAPPAFPQVMLVELPGTDIDEDEERSINDDEQQDLTGTGRANPVLAEELQTALTRSTMARLKTMMDTSQERVDPAATMLVLSNMCAAVKACLDHGNERSASEVETLRRLLSGLFSVWRSMKAVVR